VHQHRLSRTHHLTEVSPQIMRRRTLIAAALGLSTSAALPSWAAAAAHTHDPDYTEGRATWTQQFDEIQAEIDSLARTYVTERGAHDRDHVMDSGLWCFAQAMVLRGNATPANDRAARRLAAECAMFAAGCHVDLGTNSAARELYHRAHIIAGDDNRDLQAFINAQANWIPMYTGLWSKVDRRTDAVIRQAEQHGGPALLMGWTHKARARAVLGDSEGALDALTHAHANIERVPGATGISHALHYSATKVWFTSSTVYAELGDAARQNEAQHRALDDPAIGWVDRQLMRIGYASLDPDPELAARRIRLHLASLPQDSFNHCVKSEAQRVLHDLQERPHGAEVRALDTYLRGVHTTA